MPNLLAMSFEGTLAPSFDLRCLQNKSALPDGWGIGYYPGGEPSAPVLKEPAPRTGSIRSELVKAWEHLESSLFVLHVRRATWGRNSDANTQPFSRAHAGRDWLIAHGGSLRGRLPPSSSNGGNAFEPIGATDTELVFCDLLNRVAARGARSLGDVPPEVLLEWLGQLNDHGSLSLVITDGRDLVAYADKAGDGGIYLSELRPPYDTLSFSDADLHVDLTSRGAKSRKGVVVASEPMTIAGGIDAPFRGLRPGSLVVVREGAIRYQTEPDDRSARPSTARIRASRPRVAEPRTFEVTHRTVYRYARPVERSEHVLRLEPTHDKLQSVERHDVTVSVDAEVRLYEDVFGNRVRRLSIDSPFSEMIIEARSLVRVMDTDPLGPGGAHVRSSIPVAWMPWQHHMLQPYLLPPELPESQLRELAAYAMTFVNRNDSDLLDTLLDLNATLFKEYAYHQGVTTVFTTPFQTYAERRGVCQDFANLFICLARLLGVPSRYACGYVHTGNVDNQAQGQASHAWVQVYLPEVGWRGFDPTNGTLTQTDHVRVAVGRNYIDATPTSGTIFVGGGGETLEVDVRCVRVESGR